jgi:hypothetical protein
MHELNRDGGVMKRTISSLGASAHGILGALLSLLLITACTGEDGRPEDRDPESSGAELTASELTAGLNGGYKVKPNGSRVPPTERELPVPLDTVQAHWYRSGGVYVVVFGGLDLDETEAVCPGSSIQTDSGFEHVTNSPTEEGACEGAPTIAGPGAGVRTCGSLLLYITEIPEDTKGDLFASLERYERNGKIIGVTGVVAADISAAPEIDPEADAYTLPQGLIEGTTEVTC